MNNFQIHNLTILRPPVLKKLRSGEWRDSPYPILQCVKCGQYRITTPILAFFNYRGDKILCYNCQGLGRERVKV